MGDGDADHAYWGRPEDMHMARPTFTVGTSKAKAGADVVGETAAAMAAGAAAFKDLGKDLVRHIAKRRQLCRSQ